jgi:transmembrane sensor
MEELERKKQELLEKYKQGTCTPEEKALVEYIYNFSAASAVKDGQEEDEEIKAEIWTKLPLYEEQQRARHRTVRIRILSAAAAVLIVVGAGIAYFNQDNFVKPDALVYSTKIVPGTSGATLTLSDGKRIKLSEATQGELANEAGVHVIKMDDGTIVYEIKEKGNGFNKLNILATNKGETYKVRLPDGTMVWLNAASSIKYPSSFATLKQRLVELSGEAYFEVAKDKAHPFIVKTNRQNVEVFGTHFNVNAYPDESIVKTTLLEGSVKVSTPTKSKFIKPGEQLTLSEVNELKVTAIETGMAIAWKNDEFMFDDENIEQVMNTIGRWYNIDVVYKGPKPVERFGGSISRFDDVVKVLKMLQRTGAVHFDIQGRTIYVSK